MKSAPHAPASRLPTALRWAGLAALWIVVAATALSVLSIIQPALEKYAAQMPPRVVEIFTAASVTAATGPVYLLCAVRGSRGWRFAMYGLALFAAAAGAAMTADGIRILTAKA